MTSLAPRPSTPRARRSAPASRSPSPTSPPARGSLPLVGSLAILALLAAPPAGATSVLPLSPEEVDARAERVFVGRCTERRATSVQAPGGSLPAVEWTFEVEQVLAGDALRRAVASGETRLVFRQYGSLPGGGPAPAVTGMPSYEIGARYRIALHGDSPIGLTSPVGLGQGVRRLDLPSGRQPSTPGADVRPGAGAREPAEPSPRRRPAHPESRP